MEGLHQSNAWETVQQQINKTVWIQSPRTWWEAYESSDTFLICQHHKYHCHSMVFPSKTSQNREHHSIYCCYFLKNVQESWEPDVKMETVLQWLIVSKQRTTNFMRYLERIKCKNWPHKRSTHAISCVWGHDSSIDRLWVLTYSTQNLKYDNSKNV